jgi:parvulin-like peptidyl-prolyl isomerase
MRYPPMLAPFAALLLAAATATQTDPPAQADPPARAAPPVPPVVESTFVRLRYPQDEQATIAIVGGRKLSLGELVEHITKRHHPLFQRALVDHPTIQAMLTSDLMAPWVRHFADIEALKQTFTEPPIDQKALEAAQSEALRQGFQGWLDSYTAQLRQQGRPTDFDQKRINALLSDWQLRNGLASELQGWLDYLEPGNYPVGVLREFFNDNARAFGGQVTIAHILIQHRDGGTGLLLREEGRNRANARLADVRARLRPDGSNFEEIASLYSDDTKTAKDGGKIEGIMRYDDRMPAALCRAAWHLGDGEVSPDVIETQYGWHLVKRLELTQKVLALFTDATIPSFQIVMRRAQQEQRLFHAREHAAIQLLL